jgi:hypothetical protein
VVTSQYPRAEVSRLSRGPWPAPVGPQSTPLICQHRGISKAILRPLDTGGRRRGVTAVTRLSHSVCPALPAMCPMCAPLTHSHSHRVTAPMCLHLCPVCPMCPRPTYVTPCRRVLSQLCPCHSPHVPHTCRYDPLSHTHTCAQTLAFWSPSARTQHSLDTRATRVLYYSFDAARGPLPENTDGTL